MLPTPYSVLIRPRTRRRATPRSPSGRGIGGARVGVEATTSVQVADLTVFQASLTLSA